MVGVPRAEVVFRGPERVRVRIPDRRGDAGYYREVAEKLTDALVPLRIEVNAHTASVLITGAPVDVQALAETAMAQGLFCLKSTPPRVPILTMDVATPLQSANRTVKKWSGGTLDLPGGLFAALVLFGIFELLRGNWKTPPWYTAFWYAFGLYSRALFDETRQLQHDSTGLTQPEL
jgi:hypothetical protein